MLKKNTKIQIFIATFKINMNYKALTDTVLVHSLCTVYKLQSVHNVHVKYINSATYSYECKVFIYVRYNGDICKYNQI